MKHFTHSLIFLLLLLLISCSNSEDNKDEKRIIATKEDMVNVNRFMVSQDKALIEAYIKRRGWKMTKTESGLYYSVVERGPGDKIFEGDKVRISYRIELLDGTECYNSEKDGIKDISVGESDSETGLHEALQHLCIGDKAIVILPPHLAYGVMGDEKRIPPRSVIVYYLEVFK